MKKKKIIIYVLLFVLIISGLFLSYHKNTDKITIDNVSLNNIDNKSKLFAIMISENNGSDYHECSNEICNNSSFPNSAYIYQKAECLDDRGETANDVTVTYQNSQATVKSNKTVYCTLYFNKDTTKPTITKFYIKNETDQPKYSNNSTKQETATVTWNDEDVVSYCIIPINNVTSCDTNSNWKTTDSNSATLQLTLTEGSNIYYAFIKDIAGNTSALDNNQTSKSDTIILDTIAPTVDYDIKSGEYTGTQTITITPYDSGSGVGVWSVHVYRSGVVEKDATKSVDNLAGSLNYQVTLEEGTWTVHTFVYDNAGNILTQQPNPGDGWYYQTYIIKTAGSYVEEKVGSNPGTGGYTSSGVVGDPLVKRFYGKDPNNYICFGANTCEINSDYIYRIIGATSDGKLKIIKQTNLSSSQYWDPSKGVTWETAALRKQLNGEDTGVSYLTSDIFYTNETLVPSNWKQYIDPNPSWCIGDVTNRSTGSEILVQEMATCKAITSSPIGLMYLSDYYFAYDGTGSRNCYSSACSSWINPPFEMWTMSRTSTEWAWYINWNNNVRANTMVDEKDVRPVFYLQSSVKLSGSGSSTDPFIITGLAG